MNRYRLIYTLLLTALMASMNASAGVTVRGNVYGGGNEADVKTNTTVNIGGGQIDGNVYGGGNVGDVGTINKTAPNYNYVWKNSDSNGNINDTGNNNVAEYNKPSDSSHDTSKNTGICKVTITGGTIGVDNPTDAAKQGNVFGAGKGLDDTWWCEKAMVYATNVSITAGTVKGSVYGGGEIGRVEDDVKVTIGAPLGTDNLQITGNVFGAGKGLATHGYSALVRGNSDVTVQGKAKVTHSVYGGGEIATVGRYVVVGGVPTEPDGGGDCTVKIKDEAEITEDVFGAGQGVNPSTYSSSGTNISKRMMVYDPSRNTGQPSASPSPSTWQYYKAYNNDYEGPKFVWEYFSQEQFVAFLETLALASDTEVEIGGTTEKTTKVKGSVYGGSESGFLQRHTQVSILNNCEIGSTSGATDVDGYVFGGGKGLLGYAAGGRVSGYTKVAISGGTMHGSVYGGGENGYVKGGVNVNMTGGTVNHDIYGGGALADTNTGNGSDYIAVPGITTSTSVTGLYEKEYVSAGSGTAQAGVTYYEYKDSKYVVKSVTVGETSVNDLYVVNYTTTSDETAQSTKTYYTNTHSTTVNLLGGLIKGDAYGGGLGQKEGFNGALTDIPAIVWGDVDVTLNGTKFDITTYTEEGYTDIVKSGRVFGCNNLNGYPKGDVTVTVWKTVAGSHTRTDITRDEDDKFVSEASPRTYEVAAVYGGGNLADDETDLAGKKTKVVIETCNVSIREVYGGGNAAAVPETEVLVKGAYEIETVFGGGNGKDPYKKGTEWIANSGADVNGDTNTQLTGGFIHEAYGGSNKRGRIAGKVKINTGSGGTCMLECSKVVAAGKDADLDTDAILVMGCVDGEKIDQVIGGADNANVNGNVWLTITSGEFGKVFGGNNLGGVIKGSIKLNIEETGCTPIKIDELYLGGNEAAYSVYGYKTDSNGKLVPQSAQELMEAITNAPENSEKTTEEITALFNSTKYADPELNIISCTKIGKVFGGGLGTGAAMYANPTVNINMMPGVKANGIPDIMTAMGLTPSDNPNKLGIIGDVYGGGNEADVIGNTTVNIGTESEVLGLDLDGDNPQYESDGITPKMTSKDVLGAYINGNVFGGGKGVASLTASSSGEAFECAKAMVGIDQPEPTDLNGGTHVYIYNGTVTGNVYGGGEVGRVEKNTMVTIGQGGGVAPGGIPTSAPVIKGSVFGAGAGKKTHGYSALVRGNSTVTIQGNAKVEQNVYGGGQLATVGRYRVNSAGMPTTPWGGENGGGTCTVTIGGYAEIGPDDMTMTKTGGPVDYGHVFGAGMGILPYDGYGDNEQPKHMDADKVNGVWIDHYKEYNTFETSQGNDANYIKFIKTLALASYTNVTIKDNAFVKGSVYGGSENGFVQADTHVTIQDDCQIGNGWDKEKDNGEGNAKGGGVNQRYTDKYGANVWTDRDTYPSLPECASWPYEAPYAPYDRFASTESGHEEEYSNGSTTHGGRRMGSDGHTFYGNVFGGGSGYYPYRPGKWFESAGAVYGNTYVTIIGGHILTNVYGGNEMTDVGKYADSDQLKLESGGTCYVTMIGGTIGVPRTLDQIKNHPVTGYLFGAGKGDQRVFFNKSTNIGNAVIHISGGARIFGSVLGGGEDGHVMKNVTMDIGGSTLPAAVSGNTVLTSVFTGVSLGTKTVSGVEYPYIGTYGTSYFDGNVFGGGRGFGGDAYTAGNVAGKVTMNIYGGTMLGSVYGGGRLGSVGYGLFNAGVAGYGEMRPDNNSEEYDGTLITSGVSDFKRGYVDITISGGTIGNDLEYVYVPVTTLPANLQTWKNNHHIPNTDIDLYETKTVKEGDNDVTQYIYRLSHTKGGNVFAGGMGRQKTLDGADISGISWEKLGCVKQTKLTITGGKIKSNVYGGGELGAVIPAHNTTEGGNTEISISGAAVIGSEITEKVNDADVVRYTFGSVYGGGMGSEAKATTEDLIGGRVEGSTKISMTAGTVKASVYGGGELAVVKGGQAAKDIAGNDIKDSDNNAIDFGTDISISGTAKVGYNQDGFGGATMGNIYGGGKGSLTTAKAGLIKKNTLVKISGTPEIYHNIYGGGAYGSVGTFTFTTGAPTWPTANGTGKAEVIIEGGTIGVNGHENGMVFGSSRGDVATPVGDPAVDPNDKLAWVYDTHVTIGNSSAGPSIRGTVYGSGENGHVFNNTVVDIHKGTIGIASGSKITGSSGTEYEGAAYPYRGNVYGGGCGTDMYDSDGDGTEDTYNPLAGIVLGNTNITMDGGTVVHNIYGAGAMGSVGTKDNTGAITSGGTTTIAISSGNVGVDGTKGDGNIFGAARGDETSTQAGVALVKTTDVTISGNATVWGSVYGGGEVGSVGSFNERFADGKYIWTSDTENLNGLSKVTITGGETKGHVFGAGKGKANNFKCDKAMVRETQVSVSNGTVNGNVYGGGEIGRVEEDTEVKIGVAPEGGSGTYEPTIKSSVFGGGAGLETHGYSALVRGNATVIVEGGAKIGHSVYGGGEIASVGRYGLDEHKMPEILLDGGYCYVKVKGSATVGTGSTGGDVFGACKGVTPHLEDMDDTDRSKRPRRMTMYKDADFPETAKLSDTGTPTPNNGTIWEYYDKTAGLVWEYFRTEEAYDKYLQTLALATHPEVTIDGGATVNGSVYGGGEMGLTKGSVYVNILSGTITKDVYGGGALANTNTTSTKGVIGENDIPEKDGDNYVTTTVSPKTTVNLLGGSMRDAYGGGLGQLARDEVEAKDAVPAQGTEGEEGYVPAQPAIEHQDALPAIEAKVFGDVKVNLNGLNASTDIAATTLTALTEAGKLEANGSGYRVKTTGVKGAIVNRVFGCNNLNGTPLKKVQVYVHATQNKAKTSISDDKTEENRHTGFEAEDAETTYDVKAVYGGGNLAAYVPADPDKTTTLNETTEKAEVYIDGCDYTSIKTVYGGGNAASAPATCVTINGNYEIEEVFGGGNGKDRITKNGVEMDNPGANVGYYEYADDATNAATPTARATNYGYGSGVALTEIFGGIVHAVYGGSNSKGNIRTESHVILDDQGCHFNVGEAYGGGKSADMDGAANLEIRCISQMGTIYGGAENADVLGNVTLNVTNGHYDQVFGGNNEGGRIGGAITVNIEETGCSPIIIGELYGGGNKAGYSKWGYKKVDGKWQPRLSKTDSEGEEQYTTGVGTDGYADPQVNVKSFTSIGNIYGGGYGASATMVANPYIYIDEVKGRWYNDDKSVFAEWTGDIDGDIVTIPAHTKGTAIGAISNVFGGGNAAPVIGKPHVYIGTKPTIRFATDDPTTTDVDERTIDQTPVGVDIRGNVYGGGNNAPVTGDAEVIIGKEGTQANSGNAGSGDNSGSGDNTGSGNNAGN